MDEGGRPLLDQGNTVVVIEHNLDVIKTADWLIDMGPDGGDGGGRVVAEGTPEDVASVDASYTGHDLTRVLNGATLRFPRGREAGRRFDPAPPCPRMVYPESMSDTFRYAMAALLSVAAAGKLVHLFTTPPGPDGNALDWSFAAAWLAGAIAYLRPTGITRRLRGKRDAVRNERRQQALEILVSGDNLDRVLHEIRKNLGETPRRFSPQDLSGYLKVPLPRWCRAGNPLQHYFAAQEELLRDGVVVWANWLRANQALLNPGKGDAPCDIIYCIDPEEPNTVSMLRSISPAVSALAKTLPTDPRERAVSDHLAREDTPAFGIPVPPGICWWAPCALSSMVVHRQHLPNGVLSLPVMPILLNPREPRYAMIVPSRYWPDLLKTAWGP